MIGIDFETYSSVSLLVQGLDNYVTAADFQPLLVATAYWNNDTQSNDVDIWDFICEPDSLSLFREFMAGRIVRGEQFVAHNAGFERRVLEKFFCIEDAEFIDSAVISRTLGAGSQLADAAPQLLPRGHEKLEVGKQLIQKFCVGDSPPTKEAIEKDPDWELFKEYCARDALISLEIAQKYGTDFADTRYEPITDRMNQRGWSVDFEALQEMEKRYEENLAKALVRFREQCDPKGDLNLNSPLQLKKWCLDRGVKTTSFDEEHVRNLLTSMRMKLQRIEGDHPHYEDYRQVLLLLETKEHLGGSALKKLDVITRLANQTDGLLRNQYIHCGAGQSWRTTGVGVQMQNLKKLSNPRDIEELFDPHSHWTNSEMASNLRQLFVASGYEEQGAALIVGDFSSVESRGLAYEAGAEWKLKEFRAGKDMYKVMASRMFDLPYDMIVKSQRNNGKVGELACGYEAGAQAVADYASKMEIHMDLDEAKKIVKDWRSINVEIVELWAVLDELLHQAVVSPGYHTAFIGNDMSVSFEQVETPDSLAAAHPGAVTIVVSVFYRGEFVFKRVFQGCYEHGRSICYYKPSSTLAKLWSPTRYNPKTKRTERYSVYGGKLSGILTQSFCREIFFSVLKKVEEHFDPLGVEVIGQFHDEIVLDWNPQNASCSLQEAENDFQRLMSTTQFAGFPLAAEVHSDYRYIK